MAILCAPRSRTRGTGAPVTITGAKRKCISENSERVWCGCTCWLCAEKYRSPHKLILAFNEKRGELDAEVQRFERVSSSQGLPQYKWALSLSLCLTGEALSVVGRMAADAATNFTVLKQTLLQRFRYREEGYRAMLREARPEEAETGRQFTGRLLGYFDHWQETAKAERTYDALRDKIVSEQFLKRCHEKLTIFLRKRGCQGLDKLTEAADHYLKAQGLLHLGRTNKNKETKPFGQAKISKPPDATGRPACFLCNKQGHRAADCWSKSRGLTQSRLFAGIVAKAGIK